MAWNRKDASKPEKLVLLNIAKQLLEQTGSAKTID